MPRFTGALVKFILVSLVPLPPVNLVAHLLEDVRGVDGLAALVTHLLEDVRGLALERGECGYDYHGEDSRKQDAGHHEDDSLQPGVEHGGSPWGEGDKS